MKTMNFKVALMMAAVIGSTAFVSCSSDDEDGTKGGGTTSKRIVKMTCSDGEAIETTTFDYDAQGRVVKVIETDMYGGSESSTTTTTYTYGGNTIISKAHYVSGNYEYEETHTYTLSDGLIVKDVENYKNDSYSSTDTHNYTYDSNGYLKTYMREDRKAEFTWTDGNLTKWDRGNYIYTVSYSDILWPQYYMAPIDGTSVDLFLEPLGVWGKMPKNLPAKISTIYDDETKIGTIDYTIENGEITKVVYQYDDGETVVYTYEWR